MRENISTQANARLVAWAALALATVAALALFVHGASSTARAQTPSTDCFGGALSDDPIHCEVFQWAHNSGVIEVDGVYRAGEALYIYLNQADYLDSATLKKLLAKSQEIARRTGKREHECALEPLLCRIGVLSANSLDIPGYILPESSYQDIRLFPGGVGARRSSAGWPAFRQVWPEADDGVSGATETVGDFDISGVDRTNFPELAGNCNSLLGGGTRADTACEAWEYYPDLGIANAYSDRWNDKEYYYVKAAVGEEAAKIAAARTALMNSQPDYYTEERLVVVAVPHDFEELWRWSLILDRFANSSGNTLGINHVELGFNMGAGYGRWKRSFPVEDAPDLTEEIMQAGGYIDGLKLRLIIQVATLEFEMTTAGMPRLLKQLEIPESAVGLIYEPVQSSARRPASRESGASAEQSAGDIALPLIGGVVDSAPSSWWIWAAAGGAVVGVAGLGCALALRRRSSSKDRPDAS